MQSIKGVEKLFLGILLTFNKLDIIHQNHVCGTISIAKSLHTILADSLN